MKANSKTGKSSVKQIEKEVVVKSKLKELEKENAKERAWQALFAARGIFKGKGKAKTDEEFYKWRKEYGEKLAEELAKKYGIKT